MFCFECHVTNYIKRFFFNVLTLKYKCHFGMNFKKFNLKAKHKIKKINFMTIL